MYHKNFITVIEPHIHSKTETSFCAHHLTFTNQ